MTPQSLAAPSTETDATARPIVRIESVHKALGRQQVLQGVDLTVLPGQTTVILGPSGSGKTTLLRCINHLEKVDRGKIYVADELVGYAERDGKLYELKERDTARRRARIGMVFQHFNLFPHLTVLQNVTLGPTRVLGLGMTEARARGVELLERVGLGDKVDSYPRQLSGGQQQRVAIARALAMRPLLMLFDEPTSALDPELVGEVLAVIREIAQSGMTSVIVSHEIGFAREVADAVVFMDGGVVVESGPPGEVLDKPSSARTAAFLGHVLR